LTQSTAEASGDESDSPSKQPGQVTTAAAVAGDADVEVDTEDGDAHHELDGSNDSQNAMSAGKKKTSLWNILKKKKPPTDDKQPKRKDKSSDDKKQDKRR
jgi:hypothetical protein